MSDTELPHVPCQAENATPLHELVVCSLESWDEVWRRNQFLADALLYRFPALRVLFVEPPADVLFDLTQLRRPVWPRMKTLRDGRLHILRPLRCYRDDWGRSVTACSGSVWSLLRAGSVSCIRHCG